MGTQQFRVEFEYPHGDLLGKILVVMTRESDGQREILRVFDNAESHVAQAYRNGVADGIYYANHSVVFQDDEAAHRAAYKRDQALHSPYSEQGGCGGSCCDVS